MTGTLDDLERTARSVRGVLGAVAVADEDDVVTELQVFTAAGTDLDRLRDRVAEAVRTLAGEVPVYVFELAVETHMREHAGTVTASTGDEEPPADDEELAASDEEQHAPAMASNGKGNGKGNGNGNEAAAGRAQAESGAGLRATIGSIALDRGADDASASVEIRLRSAAASGRAAGSIVLPDTLRLVAAATVDAVGTLIGAPKRYVVERVEQAQIGGQTAVLVLVHRRDDERILLGACLLRTLWIHEAVVRATLDALNRQMTTG